MKEEKKVSVFCKGNSKRKIFASYVGEGAEWKSSYRIIISMSDKSEVFKLQFLALVENVTNEDWIDVALTLVSGQI